MYSNDEFLSELLVESGYINQEKLDESREKLPSGSSIIEYLINNSYVSDIEVAQTVSYNANMDFMDISQIAINPIAVESVPADVAKRYKIAPVNFDGTNLTIAVTDPLDFEVTDSLPHVLPYNLNMVCSTPKQIHDLYTQFYEEEDSISGGDDNTGGDTISVVGDEEDNKNADDAPIIKLVSDSLVEAFKSGASDIHIEPLEKYLRVRYRIDGVLHEVGNHPRKLLPAVISRLKIMSGSMSIAEKRIPQDGRIQVRLRDKSLDLRVSSVPTNHGESIVMRILDKSSLMIGLNELGFFSDVQEKFEQLIALPDGILLVTGPTGSGKTTTLYACLNHINKPDKKIITVEDPVEYELEGINQVMVRESIGMSFSSALRAILRQAPNIIMIGEIRDLETASIAINASLTGHLVFSTLHTNDAPSSVPRLVDIGVKPFLIASALRAVFAQRLVRKLCQDCKKPTILGEKELRSLNISESQADDSSICGPNGCEKCRGTGYRGRMGIIEIFEIDDEVRQMINQNLSSSQLRTKARELGMKTLREDGIRKVLNGQTSASEVIKVTLQD